MRISTLAIAALVLFVVSVPLYAGQAATEQDSVKQDFAIQEQFLNLPTREGVTVPAWVISPRPAQASIVLFAGGGGKVKISEEGVGKKGNFLIRSRDSFAERGFVVLIPDVPSDQGDLRSFRIGEDHAKDVKTMIAWLRKYNPGKPVWLI